MSMAEILLPKMFGFFNPRLMLIAEKHCSQLIKGKTTVLRH
jgi:hypothetical protein